MKIGYLWPGSPVRALKGAVAMHFQGIVAALQRIGHDIFVISQKGKESSNMLFPARLYDEIQLRSFVPSPPHFRKKRPASSKDGSAISYAKILDSRRSSSAQSLKITWMLFLNRVGEILRDRKFFQYARKVLKAEQPDSLYERCPSYYLSGIRLARELGIPYLREMNSSLTFSCELGYYANTLFLSMVRLADRQAAIKSDRVLVPSSNMASYLVSIGVPTDKIELMLNGVDLGRYSLRQSDIVAVKQRYGLENKIVVGYLTAMQPRYDIDLVLDCVPCVVERNPNIHFLLMGDGPFRFKWEHRTRREGLSRWVTFAGWIPESEVPAHMGAIDIGLAIYTPDSQFGLGIKTVEYMAAGKPVILSEVGDGKYVIDNGQNGFLVTPGSADELINTINNLADDIDMRSQIGKAARKTVESRLTWDHNAKRIEEIYESLIHKRRFRFK